MATNLLAKIASAQTVTTVTELAVAVSPAITVGQGNLGIWFSGDVQITPGTAATGVTVRLRYGSGITGAVVDTTAVIPVTAAVATQVPYNLFDLTSDAEQAGGQVYSVTVQQTAATGNGTVNGGHIGVEI